MYSIPFLFVCIQLAVTALLVSGGPQRRKVNCTDYRSNLDIWSNELLSLADRSVRLPETAERLNDFHCVRSKEASAKLKNLRVCLKPFPSQVLDVILSGTRKTMRNTCNTLEARQEFVDKTACVRPQYGKALDCIDRYVAEMEYVRDNIDNLDMKIPYTCCYYWKTRRCFLNVVAANCPESSVQYSQEHLDSLFSETTDLLCNKWEEGTSNCANLAPLNLNRKTTKNALTFVLPNLDIYTQT
ncbi:uncharacterized protein LOC107368887 [Tetranychus urticae]|nr:uncharacterized protein LOC107368887 [Tetranychus urticae]